MIDLTLDVEQYDCPFIETTADHDVSFRSLHWDFDDVAHQLETRMLATGADRHALDAGLDALESHANMCDFEIFTKYDGEASIRTVIDETAAMRSIRSNDGYVTGPFKIEDGTEQWSVGFDDEVTADTALAALEKNNDYTLQSRTPLNSPALHHVFEHPHAASNLLNTCLELTETETDTLRTADEQGYYEQPRGTTLEELADEFGISRTAVSNNMRRAERKIIREAIHTLQDLE